MYTILYCSIIAMCALSILVISDITILQPEIAIVFASSIEEQDNTDDDEEDNDNTIESSLGGSDNSEDIFLLYNNSKYGISMNYPSSWSYQEVQASTNVAVVPIVNMFPPISDDPNAVSFLEIGIENLESPFSIDEYTRSTINGYRESRQNFTLVSSNADGTLSGLPAYEIVFTDSANDTDSKIMEVGALDSQNNRIYYLLFNTEESRYDSFAPILESIVNSFQVGSIDKGDATESGIGNDTAALLNDSAITATDTSPSPSIPSNMLTDTNLLINQGNQLLDEGNYEEAITYYNQVLTIDPSDIYAIYNMGLALYYLDRDDEAIQLFDKVLSYRSQRC